MGDATKQYTIAMQEAQIRRLRVDLATVEALLSEVSTALQSGAIVPRQDMVPERYEELSWLFERINDHCDARIPANREEFFACHACPSHLQPSDVEDHMTRNHGSNGGVTCNQHPDVEIRDLATFNHHLLIVKFRLYRAIQI